MRIAFAILLLLQIHVASSAAAFPDAFSGKLEKLDPATGKLSPYEIGADAQPEYYMIYFSAGWCAPCRKMIPALVEFYRETKAQHPGFEFIFVSSDRTSEAMVDYMRWAEMPWPALGWDQRDSIPEITGLAPAAIPFMAMLDADGKMLGASDLGGFNVGIPKLINGLQAKLGSEVYDVQERHGKTPPFILAAYILAGVALAWHLVRKRRKA